LIGDDGLAAYEKHLYERWKDSREYWQDVENQATKDLEKHWITFGEQDGKIGLSIYPAAENDAHTWMDLDVVAATMDDGDVFTKRTAAALRALADRLDGHNEHS